ncbi:hypothetical protein MTR67_029430 [Solanum verrucosum]|uniref:MULE transposase domain-containing protein n=1 Tax=Solanum verrucosum TaxID=315347 RepID=A0AAF0RB39_SOLVR|nr:hypothetical protein MTR67_029430 [Solanum verrucosum]
MPFASFVGVNQHKQSILFGCALLTSEDIETYKFVFSTWLIAMGNAPPTVILIDQCESIKEAIAELQTHYTRPIYNAFAAEHLKRLYHCEIEGHHEFNVVMYSVTDYSISNDFHGNRFVYIVEYRPRNQYMDCNCKNFQSEGQIYSTSVEKGRNLTTHRNCDVVLDNNAKYADFKNVLKGRFNAYCNWNDEMAVRSVGDPDSEKHVTLIRNPREV